MSGASSVLNDNDEGGWTVIQRRGQFGNPEDYFYRKWNDYFHGFGALDREFWMGLDNIQVVESSKIRSRPEVLTVLAYLLARFWPRARRRGVSSSSCCGTTAAR